MPRGNNEPRMAFIAPPDAAVESYTDLLSSSLPEKRLQRNSTGRQATPPPDARRLQHSRSRSTLDEMLGSKRYIPSGPRPLVSHLSFSSSSATSASSSASSFVQQPQQDQLSRSNSGRLNRPHPLSVTRQQSTPLSEDSYVPSAFPSTSLNAEGSYLLPKSDLGAPWTVLADPSEILTPGIGQGKEVGAPVAGPTVVPLSPSEMIWTETSAPTASSMGLFASKPQNSELGGYDYDAHRKARSTRRDEGERDKHRQRSESQSESPPRRSRSRHRDSPPRQGRPRTRPVTPALSRSSSRSPSSRTKTIPHVAAVPYPSQQSSEMSYMFYDPELHGVGPPPPPPPALRALSSQANIGTKTTVTTPTALAAASTNTTPPDPSTLAPSKPPPPRPPRRMSPPRPARSAQTDAAATARSAPPPSNYPPVYNYASMHGMYTQSQPASGAPASAYQAATPADFVQQGYYQAAAAPMIPLYSAPPAMQTHNLATSAASSPYYASAAPPTTTSSNTSSRHTREPAYEPAAAQLPAVFAGQTSAVRHQSSSQRGNRDENTALERNTSATSTNYSYTSTDSRTTQTSANSAVYTESSFGSQRRTSKHISRPSTPTRGEDAFGESPRAGDSYATRTYVSSPFLHAPL